MRYWWVNHSQTFKEELEGQYIWSPKTKSGGYANEGYRNLTLVSTGEVIFSFAKTKIQAIGIIAERYIDADKPEEFGTKGGQWDKDGYLVKVNWVKLERPLRIRDNISAIVNHLEPKHSPIRATGDGNQGIYLAKIKEELARKLFELISHENKYIGIDVSETSSIIDDEVEQSKIESSNIAPTEKEQLIKARIGQGRFKSNVSRIEKSCRLTGVKEVSFLIASHILPWSKSDNQQKLDGNNGLLLSPHADKLFDKGFLSFTGDGEILLKSEADKVFGIWGFSTDNVGNFNEHQERYLALHRDLHKF